MFINCPFDSDYAKLFPALAFAIRACGFDPRCALEESDSGESRIEKLYRIIGECRLGIHDISRTELNRKRLPRFNMPLELGVFLGAKRFGDDRQRDKRCLILDRKPYRFQQFCSDLAGNDLRAHDNSPRMAILLVRDWLRDSKKDLLPGGDAVFDRYCAFRKDLPLLCAQDRLNEGALPFNDLVALIDKWLAASGQA
ncbi:MAG: hypothetical protein NTU83_03865 [Candidatus Hydrogenedentes bacterium]|nr:hypothetical protein [Candidatus Hydrogenedentota bacterium]